MLGNLKQKLVSWLFKDVHLDVIHIGEHSVVVSGTGINMGAQSITNANSITATELHGTTYWADICLEDIECAVCHRRFQKGDKVAFIINKIGINKIGNKYISAIPVHLMHTEEEP